MRGRRWHEAWPEPHVKGLSGCADAFQGWTSTSNSRHPPFRYMQCAAVSTTSSSTRVPEQNWPLVCPNQLRTPRSRTTADIGIRCASESPTSRRVSTPCGPSRRAAPCIASGSSSGGSPKMPGCCARKSAAPSSKVSECSTKTPSASFSTTVKPIAWLPELLVARVPSTSWAGARGWSSASVALLSSMCAGCAASVCAKPESPAGAIAERLASAVTSASLSSPSKWSSG
mmetsp:Transcript_11372/g.26281  ORF Transcript_11372/g.26281 Transcript_11372/m.26281 type:complete len:229 (+) Transcript_11372:1071-1757(+)